MNSFMFYPRSNPFDLLRKGFFAKMLIPSLSLYCMFEDEVLCPHQDHPFGEKRCSKPKGTGHCLTESSQKVKTMNIISNDTSIKQLCIV